MTISLAIDLIVAINIWGILAMVFSFVTWDELALSQCVKNSSVEDLLMLVCLLLMLSLVNSFIGNLVFMLVLNIIIMNSSASCHKFHCVFVCKSVCNHVTRVNGCGYYIDGRSKHANRSHKCPLRPLLFYVYFWCL